MVRRLDAFIVYLEQSLLMEDLENITDVIILSDHGMLTVTPRNFIDLYAFIDENFCKTYGTSPVLQVVCSDDKIQEAYANLTKAGNYLGTFKAYTDDLLLNRWHVQNSDRFGPIVGGLEFCSVFFFSSFFFVALINRSYFKIHSVVADPGYGFQDMFDLAAYMFDEYGIQCMIQLK